MNVLKKHIVLFGSLTVFLLAFILYIFVLNYMEITLNGTANGAYKAVHFHEWLHGKAYIEKANALYYPMLQLISFVFSLKTPLEIYYGIVALNGFFSCLLLAFLFKYFAKYLKSVRLGLLVTVVHFMIGGYFTLSTNNEDIFPAYAFFVWGILFFRDFLQTKTSAKLIYSIVLLTLSALIHWTIGVPSCVGLFLFMLISRKFSLKEKLKYLLISLGISLLLFYAVSIILHIPLIELIYPAKEFNSLWVSDISMEKILICIYNIPFFIFTTVTIHNLQQDQVIILLFVLFLLPIIIGIKSLYKFRKNPEFISIWQSEKSFLLILFLISLVGFGMNAYEQGYDHQFMAQPCFIFVFVFAIFLRLSKTFRTGYKSVILSGSILTFFFLYNTIFFSGLDRLFFNQFDKVKTQVDFKKTVFIGVPFRLFHIVAQLKLENPADYHSISLPSENYEDYLLTDDAYVGKYKEEITKYETDGYQIVLVGILNESSKEMGNIYIGYNLSEKMERMKNYFKSIYYVGKQIKFKGKFKGDEVTFYFLKRKHPEAY